MSEFEMEKIRKCENERLISHCLIVSMSQFQFICESKKGRMADALAHGGDEGRDKLR